MPPPDMWASLPLLIICLVIGSIFGYLTRPVINHSCGHLCRSAAWLWTQLDKSKAFQAVLVALAAIVAAVITVIGSSLLA